MNTPLVVHLSDPTAPSSVPALSTDVGVLLQQSRAAHQQWQYWSPRMGAAAPGQPLELVPGDPVQANRYFVLAARLRTEAHALDPKGAHPAWSREPVNFDHEALLDFYVQAMAR